MKCKICDAEMTMDLLLSVEFGGWIWSCCNCGYIGRRATSKEIEKYEEKVWE